jgi:hypothetical protein
MSFTGDDLQALRGLNLREPRVQQALAGFTLRWMGEVNGGAVSAHDVRDMLEQFVVAIDEKLDDAIGVIGRRQ